MKRRWWILIVVLVAFVAAAAWLWRSVRAAPAWFAPPDAADAAVVELAETVEYRLVEEFQRIRPAEESWTLRVREDQLNAWFAARLPEWLAHDEGFQWPEEMSTPHLRIVENGIDLAVEVDLGDMKHVLVARLVPEVIDGRLRLGLDRAGVGRLWVPGDPSALLVDMLEGVAPDGVMDEAFVQQLVDAFASEDGLEPGIDLTDGRRVELLDVRLGPGTMELTHRTLPPERKIGAGRDGERDDGDD